MPNKKPARVATFDELDKRFDELSDDAYFDAMAENGFERWEIAELAGEVCDEAEIEQLLLEWVVTGRQLFKEYMKNYE